MSPCVRQEGNQDVTDAQATTNHLLQQVAPDPSLLRGKVMTSKLIAAPAGGP